MTVVGTIRVQSDWDACFASKEDSFWVAHHDADSKTQGHVQVKSTDGVVLCHGSDGFRVSCDDVKSKRQLQVNFSRDNAVAASQVFRAPTLSTKSLTGGKAVCALDLSPLGELGVVGSFDGLLRVFDTADGSIRRDFTKDPQAHVGDVYTCRFFPSGQVVLTGGADMQLKIWSAVEGYCAATLRGHTGGILGTDIIDRGRNIVSCSRDGTARLWECASQATVRVLAQLSFAVNDIVVCPSVGAPVATPADPREHSTDGRMVLLAGQDGVLRGVDIRSGLQVIEAATGSPLNACACIGGSTVLAGCDNGTIAAYDARNMSTPLSATRRAFVGAIQKLRPAAAADQVWVTTGDGLSFLWSVSRHASLVDLTGPDVDPVYSLGVSARHVVTGCRDGFVRKYAVQP